MMAPPRQDIQPKRSRMKAPDCVCHTGALLQVYARALLPARVFMCQPSQVSWMADRRISQTFYCHPGRAGGTPMLLARELGWTYLENLAQQRVLLVQSTVRRQV